MVNKLVLCASLAASMATVIQGASLKQQPLYGCTKYVNGTLGLGSPDGEGGIQGALAANFVAGNTLKSLITNEAKLSVLATTQLTGIPVIAGAFEFLNCTRSLINRGYKLNVPKNFQELNDGETEYTYTWGLLRNSRSSEHTLSPRQSADSKGRLDGEKLVHAKYRDLPIEDRTFILATSDGGLTNFIEFYPFAGTGNSTKSAVVYPTTDKYGSVALSTNHIAHAGSTFLTIESEEGVLVDVGVNA